MKFWLYTSRKEEVALFPYSAEGFAAARVRQDYDNRCSVEDAIAMGFDVDGSEESGYFYIDDGGSIDIISVEEI